MGLGKKVFVRKSHNSELYKWSPIPSDKKILTDNTSRGRNAFFCTAIAGSQGEDWITTYCYEINILNGLQLKLAYVECDYVE